MKVFGYNQPDDEKPFLRLACQAEAAGNVDDRNSAVERCVRQKSSTAMSKNVELEPATTSAKIFARYHSIRRIRRIRI